MGLLDGLAGQALKGLMSGQGGDMAKWTSGIQSLLSSVGGVDGAVKAFQANGLEKVIASWTGGSSPLPINADQIKKVFGNPAIQQLAGQVGLTPETVLPKLAEFLPKVVAMLSQGQGGAGGLLGKAMGFLGK